jgi:hypothetical protein
LLLLLLFPFCVTWKWVIDIYVFFHEPSWEKKVRSCCKFRVCLLLERLRIVVLGCSEPFSSVWKWWVFSLSFQELLSGVRMLSISLEVKFSPSFPQDWVGAAEYNNHGAAAAEHLYS